jgi:hypothetical protein
MGSLIVPIGITLPPERPSHAAGEKLKRPPGLRLGELPLARGDVERLRQILSLQRRLRDIGANPRGQRALVHRSIFREALVWLEVHGRAPEGVLEHWRALAAETPAGDAAADATAGAAPAAEAPPARRRRRRRRRRRPNPAPEQ